MSRSGYIDDFDGDYLQLGRWRGRVKSAIRGKRGQAFLRELAAAMDAMPEKKLIANELINEVGECCTIGVVCKARGIDVSKIDYEDGKQVGAAVGIAESMAREIEYENDEHLGVYSPDEHRFLPETPEQRWTRMRKWVEEKLAIGARP
jgi:hypothetical protein